MEVAREHSLQNPAAIDDEIGTVHEIRGHVLLADQWYSIMILRRPVSLITIM
jgi:hypothetical protein